MKHYELLFILKPTLTEEEVKAKVDFVKEVITKKMKNSGSICQYFFTLIQSFPP